jgi:hypothetical protein
MSAMGQKLPRDAAGCMSALPPKADMCSAPADVRYGPIADSCSAQIKQAFSPSDQREAGHRPADWGVISWPLLFASPSAERA